MPTNMRAVLDKEGINIDFIGQLYGKNFPKGSLPEIESNQERPIISVEQYPITIFRKNSTTHIQFSIFGYKGYPGDT